MTRSFTSELFIPYKELEREFRSSRKHFKTLSLDELRSPGFDLFFDQEDYLEEEVAETMAETMEKYMSKTRADYGSGVARPKIEDKDHFELKCQFLKELRENTFSGSNHEDANEHIEKVLEIVDLFHVPNVTPPKIYNAAEYHMGHRKNVPIVGVPSKNTRAVIKIMCSPHGCSLQEHPGMYANNMFPSWVFPPRTPGQ
ncbi:hypothetical protein Tco_0156434 [Tanacetum coccineum]